MSTLAPRIDRDAVVLGVEDSMVKTSTVRCTVVVGCAIPFVLDAEIPVDNFGIVDLVHGDELVSEALVKLLELASVEAHGLEVDTLDGHGVVLAVGGGVALLYYVAPTIDLKKAFRRWGVALMTHMKPGRGARKRREGNREKLREI